MKFEKHRPENIRRNALIMQDLRSGMTQRAAGRKHGIGRGGMQAILHKNKHMLRYYPEIAGPSYWEWALIDLEGSENVDNATFHKTISRDKSVLAKDHYF